VVKGSDLRVPDHPISSIFLDRWSPRAMTGEPIEPAELMRLFEAARWAPSPANLQPWRMLYARRDTPQWPLFFNLLVESNQAWCRNAAALVLFISKSINERTGKPAITNSFVTGAAWENFALQGAMSGLVVHGMQGFDYERARAALQIPDDFRVEAMGAVGRPGRSEDLPEPLRAREAPNGRRPLAEIVFEGPYPATGA
jgi:nitroreductase